MPVGLDSITQLTAPHPDTKQLDVVRSVSARGKMLQKKLQAVEARLQRIEVRLTLVPAVA